MFKGKRRRLPRVRDCVRQVRQLGCSRGPMSSASTVVTAGFGGNATGGTTEASSCSPCAEGTVPAAAARYCHEVKPDPSAQAHSRTRGPRAAYRVLPAALGMSAKPARPPRAAPSAVRSARQGPAAPRRGHRRTPLVNGAPRASTRASRARQSARCVPRGASATRRSAARSTWGPDAPVSARRARPERRPGRSTKAKLASSVVRVPSLRTAGRPRARRVGWASTA